MEVLAEVDTDEDHLEADIAVDRLEVLEDTVEEVVEVQVEDTREEVLLLEKEDIAEVLQVVLVVDTEVALRVAEAVDTEEEAHLDDQVDTVEVLQVVLADRTEVIEMIVEILRDVHTTHNKKRGLLPLFYASIFSSFILNVSIEKSFARSRQASFIELALAGVIHLTHSMIW